MSGCLPWPQVALHCYATPHFIPLVPSSSMESNYHIFAVYAFHNMPDKFGVDLSNQSGVRQGESCYDNHTQRWRCVYMVSTMKRVLFSLLYR